LDHGRNGLRGNLPVYAIKRRQPLFQGFCALACVAANAAKCDIVARDNFRIVDDMFPRELATAAGYLWVT